MQTIGESNYSSWTSITLSDTTPVYCRGIFVTGAGTVIVRQVGTAVDLTITATASQFLPIHLHGGTIRTGGTATGIFALN